MYLEVNPDTVRQIIDAAREFHAKEGVTIDDPSGEWPMQILADQPGDETADWVKTIISDLEPDQQAELITLMWVGRGDFTPEEWEAAFQQACKTRIERGTADYLLRTPLVADFLAEGLNLLGYGNEQDLRG